MADIPDTPEARRAERDRRDADPGPHLTRLAELLTALAELVDERGRALVAEARAELAAQVEAQRQERIAARLRASRAGHLGYHAGRGGHRG